MLDKKLFLTKHAAIYDPEFQRRLWEAPWQKWLGQPGYFEVKEEYLEAIHNWIHNSKINKVSGLDRFKFRDLIHGTTQAFDEAYYRYKERTLRMYRGEYAYHKRVTNSKNFIDTVNGDYIPIEENDWVIISLPFCGNGSRPPFIEELLYDCAIKKVPVLIDCAWYGTAQNFEFIFLYSAITEVCFSLTKSLGLGRMRTGIRYSNYDDNLPIRQQNNYNHLPLALAQIGLWQMEEFSCDYIPDKYQKIVESVCLKDSISSTPVMHIGLLDKDHPDYDYYLIDNLYSKVGIREAVKKYRKKLENEKR